MASIDPNKLDFQWRNYAGQSNLSNTYSVRFNYEGQPYTFIPESVINNGVTASNGNTYLFTDLLNPDKQKQIFSNATPIDLAGVSWFGDWLKNDVGESTNGYLIPGDADLGQFQQYKTSDVGTVKGIGKDDNGNPAYITSPTGYNYGYVNNKDYLAHRITITPGHSLLGDVFGSFGEDIAGTIRGAESIYNSLGPVGTIAANIMAPGAGTGLTVGSNVGNAAATGNLDAGKLAGNLAASYAGSQVGGDVAGSTGSNVLGGAAAGTTAGLLTGQPLQQALTSGAITGAGTGIANAINTNTMSSPVSTSDFSSGANYSAPSTGGGLGIKATMGQGTDLFGNLSGGDGLSASSALFGAGNLSSMGGGQGLTLPSATGVGTLGEGGIGNAWGVKQSPLDINSQITNPTGGASTPISASITTSLLSALLGGNTGASSGIGNNMATTTQSNIALGNLLGGILGGVGGLMQGSTDKAALQGYADAITKAGQQAQGQAAFRPVGTTTTFGTSNFTIDPVTGQVTSAGYSLTPEAKAIQDALMAGTRSSLQDVTAVQNLGRGYLATSPEAAAQQWYQQQQNILAPQREQQMARLNQANYNQGTTGLRVGGTSAGGLQASNPMAQALANAWSQQDTGLLGQAQEQGRAATNFGAGLLSNAYAPVNAGLTSAAALEKLGQQPLGLSTDLANIVSQRGAVTGGLGLNAATKAGGLMADANTYNPLARAMVSAGSSPMVGNALGNLLGNTSLGSSVGNWLSNLGSDYFTGSNGLNTSNIDLNYINSMLKGQDPYSDQISQDYGGWLTGTNGWGNWGE